MRPRTTSFVPGRVGSGVGWRPRFVVLVLVLVLVVLVLVVPPCSVVLSDFLGGPGPPRWPPATIMGGIIEILKEEAAVSCSNSTKRNFQNQHICM